MAIKPLVRLAVDIGGTFTDVVLEVEGRFLTKKVLTTAKEPELGVIEGARQALNDASLSFADIDVFVHGTTLATNAVLERRGAKTALIATAGYRDILEIATEGRFDQYDLQIEKRRPLVPRSLRLPVPERMNSHGQVLMVLDEAAVANHAVFLRQSNIESVAICFLHAYANGDHEQRARDIISEAMPNISISISSEICPEIREYERTSTTVANAYVQPQIEKYLARMRKQLTTENFRGMLYLVTSNGDLTSLETAQRFPVRLIESGPAGGAIFAADIACKLNEKNALSFDMGGTTAKICSIKNFIPDRDRLYEVDRAARFQKGSGLPLRIPVIDLVEIGAGGGSIASINALKGISVGPQSAGSEPGPVCYGRGGTLPTVTDADAVLGMIDPTTFAGGSVALDLQAANEALKTHVGDPLGMSAYMAAYATHEMVCESMASAARAHIIEKGRSISEHTMIAFGGAAPLHVARVAEKIGIKRIIIPAHAGVGSAVGFLRAPVSYEIVKSSHARLELLDTKAISDLLDGMAEEAHDLVKEGALGASLVTKKLAFMRYIGQGHEIAVVIPNRRLVDDDKKELEKAFERSYSELFHRTIPDAAKEILSWSVIVSTEMQSPMPEIRAMSCIKPNTSLPQKRRYFDGRKDRSIDIELHRRDHMKIGQVISGPALIVEDETTTFVSASFNASIDAQGNIILQSK